MINVGEWLVCAGGQLEREGYIYIYMYKNRERERERERERGRMEINVVWLRPK